MRLSPITEQFGSDDQRWLASSHGTDTADTITVTATSTEVTAQVIPSGTLLALDGTINPDGTTKHAAGFLLEPIFVNKGTGSYIGAIVRHGQVSDTRRQAKGLAALTSAQKTDLAANAEIILI